MGLRYTAVGGRIDNVGVIFLVGGGYSRDGANPEEMELTLE